MSQPGRPDRPEAFWWNLDQELLGTFGLDPTLQGAVLTILKRYITDFHAVLNMKETWTREEVWDLMRDHIYGWPKPGI